MELQKLALKAISVPQINKIHPLCLFNCEKGDKSKRFIAEGFDICLTQSGVT